MKFLAGTVFIGLILSVASCKKEDPEDNTKLPEGATPYTEADIQFVPYQSTDKVFKMLPLLDSTLIFQFKQRSRTEEYFAWDQTFFTYSTDADLEIEFRLRYLQTDNTSQKTLAMYLPYKDATDIKRTNLFEVPITSSGIETGFFKELVDFHDTLMLNAIEWYDVFEIKPLLTTDAAKDGPENYNRVYYNSTYGLIKMDQKNGTEWMLQQ